MACDLIDIPGVGRAIFCGSDRRRQKCRCGRPATLLCDWKIQPDERVREMKRATCDTPLCTRCTTSPAPGKDLCPAHAKAFDKWRERR